MGLGDLQLQRVVPRPAAALGGVLSGFDFRASAYDLNKLYSVLGQARNSWKLRPKQSMSGGATMAGCIQRVSGRVGQCADQLVLRAMAGGGVGGCRGLARSPASSSGPTRSLVMARMLSYEDTNGNGTEMNLGTAADGLDAFLSNNVPLGGAEIASGLYINRNSLTSTGWKMVRANFRFAGTTPVFSGLFRGLRSADELMINSAEKLPEIAAGFTIDTDFGVAGDGTAFYSVTNGANRVFYRHDFTGRQKLIAVGDAVQGSKVRSFLGGRTNEPATWFDEDGTAIVGVVLEDNSQWYLAFGPDGKISASLRLTSQAGILYRHPQQGTLIYANPYNNQGNGAYLWQGTSVKPVYVFGKKLFDQTIQEIESGTIDKQGEIVLMLRGDTSPLIVARMDGTPYVLFQGSDTVNVTAPVNLGSFVPGARVGPPHVMAGGNPGSIARFSDGDWEATLASGERMPGSTTMWFGGSVGSISNMRKAPNGDVYFTNGLGIAKIGQDGAVQMVQSFPLKVDSSLTINVPSGLDINSQGDVLFYAGTSAGDVRFCILPNGQPEKIQQVLTYSPTASTATVINGQTVTTFDSFGLADDGRVIAALRFRNVATPSIAVWDGNAWTLAASVNSKIGRHTVVSLPNLLRASGPHLMIAATVETGGNILAEWTGADWNVLLDVDTIMPSGQIANSVAAADLNRNGDALFQGSLSANSIIVRRGGQFRQVHNMFKQTPDGDWLIRLVSIDLRDDGTVYFLAVNQDDDIVLYQADPIQ